VDRFGRTSLALASLGFKAHSLDTMAHTPDDAGSLWRPIRQLGGSILAHWQPNVLRPVIHRVALAEFEDEPPETEQTDAQKSEFTDSIGLFQDHLFPHFHPSGAL
jgi:hypothetical protein